MACWHTCLPTPWPTLFPQKPAPLVHSQCACTHRHRALCHQGSRDAPEESEGCTHQARSGRMPIAEPLCLPQQSISSSKVERQKKKKSARKSSEEKGREFALAKPLQSALLPPQTRYVAKVSSSALHQRWVEGWDTKRGGGDRRGSFQGKQMK